MIGVPGIARGVIKAEGEGRVYDGVIPFEPGQDVVLMDMMAFNLMFEHQMGALLASPVHSSYIRGGPVSSAHSVLPGSITSPVRGERPSLLRLDDEIYSLNPGGYLFARWASDELRRREGRA